MRRCRCGLSPEFRNVASSESGGVVFIGSHDPLREELLGEAVGMGLPLALHGAGWLGVETATDSPTPAVLCTFANQVEYFGKEGMIAGLMRMTYKLRRKKPNAWIGLHAGAPLSGDAFFQVTRSSPVVVGINRCPSFRRPFWNPLRYSRLRDIEAPMLGACYLTERAPGLADLFDLGTEIETYADATELVEKSKALQGDLPAAQPAPQPWSAPGPGRPHHCPKPREDRRQAREFLVIGTSG